MTFFICRLFVRGRLTAVLGIAGLMIALTGCSHFQRHESEKILSPKDRAAATEIDTQVASGRINSTEAAIEKDSLRGHSFKF